VLEPVAVTVRDLEVTVIVCATTRPRQYVVDRCRQRVILPLGPIRVFLRPVQLFPRWDVFPHHVAGQDRNWPGRPVAYRAGGVAADTAHPAVPVADSVPFAAANLGHKEMLEPVTDAKAARQLEYGAAVPA
jgi:hypothetical protein